MEPTEEDIVRTPPLGPAAPPDQETLIQQILTRIQEIVTERVQQSIVPLLDTQATQIPQVEANRYNTPVEIQVVGYTIAPHSVFFGDFQEAYLWVQQQVEASQNEVFDILPFLTSAQAMDTVWASGNIGFSVAFSQTTSYRAFYRPQ
jgi:hypothetical protein